MRDESVSQSQPVSDGLRPTTSGAEPAAAFKLDTSGTVALIEEFAPGCDHVKAVEWSDLDPFTQGYVEALFATLQDATHTRGWAFRYLAPDTLAAILKDCERFWRCYPDWEIRNHREQGLWFWRDRNAEALDYGGFPPLDPYLDGDGKVRLRLATEDTSDVSDEGPGKPSNPPNPKDKAP